MKGGVSVKYSELWYCFNNQVPVRYGDQWVKILDIDEHSNHVKVRCQDTPAVKIVSADALYRRK